MTTARWQQVLYRGAAGVFVIAALAYAGVGVWRGARQSRTSEKDQVILVCATCDAESVLPSAEFRKLKLDPETRGFQCPKCGAVAAQIASVRCAKCGRAIPPQPRDAPLACPFCQAPFIPPPSHSGP